MSHERRVLSLMHWIGMLKQDIEIQRRSKDGLYRHESLFSLLFVPILRPSMIDY